MSPADLKRRRLRLGLNRDQLAHQVGVNPSVVADWEAGVAPIACPRAVEQILRQREERERFVA